MRISSVLVAVSVLATAVTSTPIDSRSLITDLLGGADLSLANFYGAPIRPWETNSQPGWYHGNYPALFPELTCLSGFICFVLQLLPLWLHCPPPMPSDGYTQTFYNLTGATQASDYLTYGLVDTVAQCKAMCDGVSGCKFVNTYHDVNGKGGSTQLTCSLFSNCHDSSDATNTGGQTQPDGSLDYITNSDGYCKP